MPVHQIQWAVVSVVAGLVVMTPAPARAQAADRARTSVQAIGGLATELVREGRERSPTFRTLLNEIGSSDWIVFIQTGSCRLPGLLGCLLHRVGTFDGQRYVRIVFSDASGETDEVIATIGHELQHAAEVVGAPRINEAADVRELYRRIGYVSMRAPSGDVYETARAIKTGATILGELRAERRAAQRTGSR